MGLYTLKHFQTFILNLKMKITDACVGQDHELNIFYIDDFDFNLMQIYLKTNSVVPFRGTWSMGGID